MTQFGDKTEHSRDFTDGAAIRFANKHFKEWRRVDNLGMNGIRLKLRDSKEVVISLNEIEALKNDRKN